MFRPLRLTRRNISGSTSRPVSKPKQTKAEAPTARQARPRWKAAYDAMREMGIPIIAHQEDWEERMHDAVETLIKSTKYAVERRERVGQ